MNNTYEKGKLRKKFFLKASKRIKYQGINFNQGSKRPVY